jgi:hypothetical protein
MGRFRRERDRTSCDDNPTDIVSSPVGYRQAAIVHYFSDHNSPRDDMSCSNEAIIAKRIPSNKPEEILKAVCPQSREAPIFVGNSNEVDQYKSTIENSGPGSGRCERQNPTLLLIDSL